MTMFVEVDDTGRTTVHKLDEVGNNLTHEVLWCETHCTTVRMFNDGSSQCVHTLICDGIDSGDHVIVAGPWEHAPFDAASFARLYSAWAAASSFNDDAVITALAEFLGDG